MTQEALTAKFTVWRQRQVRAIQFLKIAVVSCCAVLFLLDLQFDTSKAETSGRMVYPAILLLLVLATYVARRLIVQRIARHYGVSCPHCQKSLGPIAPSVVETGKCGYCGEVIVTEADA